MPYTNLDPREEERGNYVVLIWEKTHTHTVTGGKAWLWKDKPPLLAG